MKYVILEKTRTPGAKDKKPRRKMSIQTAYELLAKRGIKLHLETGSVVSDLKSGETSYLVSDRSGIPKRMNAKDIVSFLRSENRVILEKAKVKGFTRVRRGKMERVSGYDRSQAEKYFISQPRGFLGSEIPVAKEDVKLVEDKIHGKVWLNEATGEVIPAKGKAKQLTSEVLDQHKEKQMDDFISKLSPKMKETLTEKKWAYDPSGKLKGFTKIIKTPFGNKAIE